jgi:hypothetical protein
MNEQLTNNEISGSGGTIEYPPEQERFFSVAELDAAKLREQAALEQARRARESLVAMTAQLQAAELVIESMNSGRIEHMLMEKLAKAEARAVELERTLEKAIEREQASARRGLLAERELDAARAIILQGTESAWTFQKRAEAAEASAAELERELDADFVRLSELLKPITADELADRASISRDEWYRLLLSLREAQAHAARLAAVLTLLTAEHEAARGYYNIECEPNYLAWEKTYLAVEAEVDFVSLSASPVASLRHYQELEARSAQLAETLETTKAFLSNYGELDVDRARRYRTDEWADTLQSVLLALSTTPIELHCQKCHADEHPIMPEDDPSISAEKQGVEKLEIEAHATQAICK